MKILSLLFTFYIRSSIHVSVAVTSLAGVTLLEFGYPLNFFLLLFVFLGTIVGYNFVKYAGISNLHHLENTPNIRLIQWFSVICFPALIYVSFQLSSEVLIAGASCGAFTLLYALPIYNGRNLRSLSGVKIFVIALVWAGSTVVIPLITHEEILSLPVILKFVEHFLFVSVLMLPFEIRDLKYDPHHLNTLPQVYGVIKTKRFGASLLLLMLFLKLISHQNGIDFLVMTGVVVLTLLFLFKSTENQRRYFASFWIEGIPVFWFVILYLVKS
ncbi:MAG: hypothetical protein WEA58_14380 [Balneolaceae bacterium]